jgi:flagellar protein FliS
MNPYQEYIKQEVMTSSPMELIIMLYTACVKQMKIAKIDLQKRDFEKSNQRLQKAQDIITELMLALDYSFDISNELFRLYDYIRNEIIQINIHKNPSNIDSLVNILSSLRETWIEVQKEMKEKGAV